MRNFSLRAQRLIFALAQQEAQKSRCSYVMPEHFLLALLKKGDSVAYELLKILNINVLNFQLALEQSLIPTKDFIDGLQEIPNSRRLNVLIDTASEQAVSLHDNYIGTEHLLLACILEQSSITNRYFFRCGLSFEIVKSLIPDARKNTKSSATQGGEKNFHKSLLDDLFGPLESGREEILNAITPSSESNLNDTNFDDEFIPLDNKSKSKKDKNSNLEFLLEFSRDLTKECTNNQIDNVVGREDEINRVIQILSRRTKNNPLLIGEPGVGKTAIVEGLAQAIVKGNVPYNLLRKKVFVLDIGALLAGTKYRGDFEERIKKILQIVKEDKSILLFIDEIHTLIGAGGQVGQLDASNLLKPALSRAEIQVIGATTRKEYSRYLEKDSAFERRFQLVKVEEPTETETTKILEGIKVKYENFHNVRYNENVIPLIVKLSHRYIPERFLPDKAIDILDEAGAQKKIVEASRPQELQEIEDEIEKLISEKQLLVSKQNYEKAAYVRDKVIQLRKKLDLYSNYWKTSNGKLCKEVVENDVYTVINKMTGIPVNELDEKQIERLINMEDELHKTVIGQNDAINLISSAVRRSRAGVSDTMRPIGSFVFLGPTGVGKTKLAKTLAKFLFGTEDSLIRIDMSDFMERHNASRLIGAPPGYVGHEDGGVLTEQVREHPYSVVLFDEIEKAHPSIFNLLLQILEEGELQDSLGHTVSFKNCVVIMTSNAGAREIISEGRIGFSNSSSSKNSLDFEQIKSSAISQLKKIMSPELINRIDDIIVFNSLTKKEIASILEIQLNELITRLEEKHVSIKFKQAAKDYLIENGYNEEMGARPMRRLIQREIEDPLSVVILKNANSPSTQVTVDFVNDKICVKQKKEKQVKKSMVDEFVIPVQRHGNLGNTGI